jgi:short-subunit dehydrogenase/CRP-like cAMP-binding protein
MKKTVLITGASAGIGKATAIYLAQNGYNVYGAARRIEKMQDLKGYGIKPVSLDVTSEESIVACVEQILSEAGSIDILVNNAGSGYYGALEDMSISDAKYQMEVNVFGVARLIQLVLPTMRKNNFGKIVNISSVGGKVTLPMGGWYHASKFAIEGLSDALRKEVKSFGIDVIVVEPGGTKSEMVGLGTEYMMGVSGSTPYGSLAKGVGKMYSKIEKDAAEPIVIAKLIREGIEARNPKTRYVGASGAKMMLFFRKILSDKLFDKMLINYLLQFGNLNTTQIDLIKSKVVFKELKKDEYFQEAGKIPREIIFLTEGIMSICYYNNKGDEITKYFMEENHFLADIISYNQEIPSTEYIQAVTDCSYFVLSKNAMKELSLTIIEWDNIIAKITAKGFADKVNKISPMMTEDARERYLSFLEKFPSLANRVPLSYLASYLGITQSSLSRIRRNIR